MKNKSQKEFEKNAESEMSERMNNLVLAVKGNDTASFLELLGMFSHTVSSLARSFSLPVSEHEDLCQEGRMALYRAAMSYDGKSAKFSTYAITCMTNAMITFAKKYKSHNQGKIYSISTDECDYAKENSSADGNIISALEVEELFSKEGFAGLSEYEKRVMSMKFSGYKVGEIARKLEKQPKSIENTLFRARQKLKKYIEG